MARTVLIDTNVLLDDLLMREPFQEDARRVVEACRKGQLQGVVAAHSIPNMFYILRRQYSSAERRQLLLSVCEMFHVEGIDGEKLRAALSEESFADFEDCLQDQCAKRAGCDYIVTENVKDYEGSEVPAITPGRLLEMLEP